MTVKKNNSNMVVHSADIVHFGDIAKVTIDRESFEMVRPGEIVTVTINNKDQGKFKVYYRRQIDDTFFMKEIKD